MLQITEPMSTSIIDEYCSKQGGVYGDYDCTLNMTDIKTNKNKFYIMQIIECGAGVYTLYIRYGRIGERPRFTWLHIKV